MPDNALTYFQVISDFDAQSAQPTCYISHLGKQEPGLNKQEHEVDPFILRGPEIDFEGHLDIRPEVVLTTAHELGMVFGEDHEEVEAALHELQKRHEQLQDVHDELVQRYDQLMSFFAEATNPEEEIPTDPDELEELIDSAKR